MGKTEKFFFAMFLEFVIKAIGEIIKELSKDDENGK